MEAVKEYNNPITVLANISSMGLLNDLSNLGDRLIELNIAKHQQDIVVEISRDACNAFEFYKEKMQVKAVYNAGIKAIEKWEKTT